MTQKLDVSSMNFILWKNDRAIKLIKLKNKNGLVKVALSDFYSESKRLLSKNYISIIGGTKAYIGHPGGGYNQGNYPFESLNNRKLSYDIVLDKCHIKNNHEDLYVFICIETDINAKSGIYTGKLTISDDNHVESIDISLEVLNHKLELDKSFDLEFWQHPFSSAEYYGVEAFSKKHIQILKNLLGKYKESFGNSITASIIDDPWDRQTYSKNDIHYPSMIKWKVNNGKFEFDYEIFDRWVELCLSCGVSRKIACYGIAPWHESFRYEEDGSYIVRPFDKNSDEYRELWSTFLEDFSKHLQDKNWFDIAYIGIDERGFSNELVDLIRSIKVADKTFKICAAIDKIEDNYQIVKDFEDLTIGDNIPDKHPKVYKNLIRYRKARNLKTTLYSCTGHIPGNFSLSLPEESLWAILYAYKNDADGFLRWAYDAWVEDPLRDVTHSSFEAGDCFLIYPREKNDINYFYSSIRLEMMIYGVFIVNKLRQLSSINNDVRDIVDGLLEKYIKRDYESSGHFLSEKGKNDLKKDIDKFIEEINKFLKN